MHQWDPFGGFSRDRSWGYWPNLKRLLGDYRIHALAGYLGCILVWLMSVHGLFLPMVYFLPIIQ